MVSSVDNINNYTAAGKAQAAEKNSLAGNFNDFLLLLTTQLKYQDPTEAQDPSVFTQQLVQLSSLEQQINSNKKLDTINASYTQSQVTSAAAFVDKQVETAGNKTYYDGGNTTSFVYNLPTQADDVNVTIKNSLGVTVFEGKGTKAAGRNEVVWSGIKSDGQTYADPGEYSITVNAVDSSQKAIAATTLTSGRISSVDIQDGQVVLMMGTIKVPLDQVLSIRNPIVLAQQ